MILSAALLLAAALPLHAELFSGHSFIEGEQGRFEFGLDWGMVIPTRKRTFSHTIDNAQAYNLLANESVGDEVAEGFQAPPFPGTSIVGGTMRPIQEIGGHLFYRLTPWVAWGVDAGFGLKNDVRIDSPGIYRESNFLKLTYTANMSYVDLPFKIGPKNGVFRPYLLAGPGVYVVYERVTVSFNDADDPQLAPLRLAGDANARFGLAAGAGLDVRIGERGVIGGDLVYHKVLAGPDAVDFVAPKLRFSVLF